MYTSFVYVFTSVYMHAVHVEIHVYACIFGCCVELRMTAYICMALYDCVHKCTCISMCFYICLCLCRYVSVSVYVHVYTSVCAYVRLCLFLYMSIVHVCLCMLASMYVHTMSCQCKSVYKSFVTIRMCLFNIS